MTYYVYSLNPIDWWTGWRETADILRDMREMGDEDAWKQFLREVVTATDAAKAVGFDGGLRESIHVAPLPRAETEPYGDSRWMFGIKQDNNGTTFIVSPYPLVWLGHADEVNV